jgi:hypothetical protein
MGQATDEASREETPALEGVEHCDRGAERDHVDKALQSLSAGIARIERKLDRILALAVESRTRQRL